MRKLIVSQHVTLDSFLAGPNGEMNWIKLDDEVFNVVATFTNEAEVALYGRVTYEMMEAYWPTAADKPNATNHDIEHAAWYNSAQKVVLSRTSKNTKRDKTTFIAENAIDEIAKLKREDGKNILVFGSPSVVHLLVEKNLIDDYWLFVNPVVLGEGIPMFPPTKNRINLKLETAKVFACGVVGLHYTNPA